MAPGREEEDVHLLGGDAGLFTAALEQSGLPFLIAEQSEDRAVLAFTGPFEGREVVWRCEFVTLDAEFQRLVAEGSGETKGLRNFIEIADPAPDGVPLRVGLALPRIDMAAISGGAGMSMVKLFTGPEYRSAR